MSRGDETAWVFVDIERPSPGPDPTPGSTPRPTTLPPPPPGAAPGPPAGYTCDLSPTTVVGSRDPSSYRLYEVGFETFRDYERVILRLRRTGTGSSPPLAEARLLEAEALDPDTLPADVTAAPDACASKAPAMAPGSMATSHAGCTSSRWSAPAVPARPRTPTCCSRADGCYQLRVPAWQSNVLDVDRDRVDVYIDFER